MKDENNKVGSLAAVASHFDVSFKTIEQWVAKGCPRVELAHRRYEYDLKAIEDWKKARSGIEPEDPLLVGPATPALERYRLARAKQVEFQLEREIGKWVSKELIAQELAVFAAGMRQAFDTLHRQFGEEPYAIVSDALDEAEKRLSLAIGDIPSADLLDFVNANSSIERSGSEESVAQRGEDDAPAEDSQLP